MKKLSTLLIIVPVVLNAMIMRVGRKKLTPHYGQLYFLHSKVTRSCLQRVYILHRSS